MVPVTNEPKPWSVHVQTTHSDMSDLKHAQLRDFLAGNYMTGSGVNKKLAVHYKFWTKVILPEAEAKAHLEICQLSGEAGAPRGLTGGRSRRRGTADAGRRRWYARRSYRRCESRCARTAP